MRKQGIEKRGTVRRILVEIILFTIPMAGVCVLFRLEFLGGLFVWGTGLALLPVLDTCLRRSKRAQEEYFEITTYMEQLLCSYKRLGSVRLALEDCRILFVENSKMGMLLRQALYTLKTGEGVSGKEILSGAFCHINEQYSSRRLRLLHEFLCNVEKMGGDTAEALDILLNDLQMWKRRTRLYQKKKQFIRIESGVATVLAGVMCYVSQWLIPSDLLKGLTQSRMYQISTAIVLAGLLCAEVIILHKLTGSWLDEREILKDKEERRQKTEYLLLKRQKAGVKSLSAHMAKKICQREVEKEFPYWLLSVTLYLQQESVFHAVKQSLEQTRGVFREEVRLFLDRLYEEPASLLPYTEFFCQLQLPEIQTGMKILYSVNTNGYQETRKQVRFLVEQNNIVMDKCERNRFENQTAGMGLLKQIPMILACVKVVLDMSTLLMMTMGQYQQML